MFKMLKPSCRNGASMGKELAMKERKKERKPLFRLRDIYAGGWFYSGSAKGIYFINSGNLIELSRGERLWQG